MLVDSGYNHISKDTPTFNIFLHNFFTQQIALESFTTLA